MSSYNVYPLIPHFIVKTGVYRIYIIFLISAQKPRFVGTRENRLIEAILTSTHNLCFVQQHEKY